MPRRTLRAVRSGVFTPPRVEPQLSWRAIPWSWWLLGFAVLALGVGPVLVPDLDVPAWKREVDLEVYRAAGQSVLHGRSLYDYVTDVPNLLPFTYPPFAAVVAIPLALVPFGVAQGIWVVVQVALMVLICAISARPLLVRCGPAAPVALAALTTAGCWTLPVDDGLFFGQVGVLLTFLCLLDVTRGGRRWSGWLVGAAAALKLTPGLFVVLFALAGRWRSARNAVIGGAAITLGTALVIPQASVTYWGGALFDSSRIGDTRITYNGSLIGAAARLGPGGAEGRLLWGLIGMAVTAYGLWLGSQLARRGEEVAAVAAVGLLTVLVSPIAWLHHMVWVVPAILALVGDGRSVRRAITAVAVWFLYSAPLELPWRGGRWIYTGATSLPLARLAQSSFTAGAVLILIALHVLVLRSPAGARDREVPHSAEREVDLTPVS